MADVKMYLAIGEEAARGTAESTTVGFIPLKSVPDIKFNAKDEFRKEVRGDDSIVGYTTQKRYQRSWDTTLEMVTYTEGGGASGAATVGTMLKHFFGKVTSSQNASTGQYRHILYPVSDAFLTGSALEAKALTLNQNLKEGESGMKNWPWVGGRVKSLSITQDPASPLVLSFGMMGQFRDTTGAEIGTPTFASEGLALTDAGLKVYTGTITRTGSAPNFTAFTFGSATQVYPQKVSIKLENGYNDVVVMSGVDYPSKTRIESAFKASVEMQFDWEDPASGFSSVDEFNAWIASASTTNFCFHWDSGTQAGTGDNHALYLDFPVLARRGGKPAFDLEKDPAVTFTWEAMFDGTTCEYLVGCLLKNTAAAV